MPLQTYDFRVPDPTRPSGHPEGSRYPSGVLIPFEPQQLESGQVIGRTVRALTPYAGTEGMSGPGFVGLQLDSEWLIIALFGAGEWITGQGRLVTDFFYRRHNRPRPWLINSKDEWLDELSPQIVGRRISGVSLRPHFLRIDFENGFDLTIVEDASARPLFEGNQTPRTFEDCDDLRKFVFLCPTAELWIV